MSIEAMKLALEALENSKPSDAGGVLDAEAMNGLWHAHYAAKNALRAALSQQPATPEPVVWNSIQIASWIGSQLMHQPPMFERSLVCKFVRSLGRHPTLLKHSPSTHPPASAPSVPDDVVRDAERFRRLNLTEEAIAVVDSMLARTERQP